MYFHRMILEIGTKVILVAGMKSLAYGSVGVIEKMHKDWCVVVYPQNASYEDDGNGGWKPIKNATGQVYCHSAKFTELKIIN